MVLESPHLLEFDERYEPIGPAQGPTGASFKRQFVDRAKPTRILDPIRETHAIILMNAVEYQCSMGLKLSLRTDGKQRDKVFRTLWFCHGGRENFELRLGELKLDVNDILVNACTQGKTKDAGQPLWRKPRLLNEYVQDSIEDFYGSLGGEKPRFGKLTHPSSWRGVAPT